MSLFVSSTTITTTENPVCCNFIITRGVRKGLPCHRTAINFKCKSHLPKTQTSSSQSSSPLPSPYLETDSPNKYEIFCTNLVKLSVSYSLTNSLTEWKYVVDFIGSSKCLCGSKIQQIYIFKNINNNKTIEVGSICCGNFSRHHQEEEEFVSKFTNVHHTEDDDDEVEVLEVNGRKINEKDEAKDIERKPKIYYNDAVGFQGGQACFCENHNPLSWYLGCEWIVDVTDDNDFVREECEIDRRKNKVKEREVIEISTDEIDKDNNEDKITMKMMKCLFMKKY